MNSLDILTNDAKYLLSKMYAEYIECRNNGATKFQATNFGDLDSVHKDIMPEWKKEDVKFTIRELANNDFLNATFASFTYYKITINPIAISLMESKFKDKADAVLDYAVKIKSLIPFV